MKNVLILGAAGQIAQQAIPLFLKEKSIDLTLFSRHPRKLSHLKGERVNNIEGDVLEYDELKKAVEGKDIVYANLAGGDLDKQASNIVKAMDGTGVSRLIFIASLGIYDEVPGAFGKWNHKMIDQYLKPYIKAAEIIEASDLNYTILRPAWLTDHDEVDYEITQKGEPFKGTEVSRKSVAALVVRLVHSQKLGIQESWGVNKPNTEGDKPSWY